MRLPGWASFVTMKNDRKIYTAYTKTFGSFVQTFVKKSRFWERLTSYFLLFFSFFFSPWRSAFYLKAVANLAPYHYDETLQLRLLLQHYQKSLWNIIRNIDHYIELKKRQLQYNARQLYQPLWLIQNFYEVQNILWLIYCYFWRGFIT